MASSSGRPVWTDQRTGRTFYYDQQTNEYVFSDGSRVLAASQPAQPAVNVPRTVATGAVRQLPANVFSSQPYNQQYTSSPPIASGSSLQNVTQQLRNVKIAQPSAPVIPYAAGRPIDGADVVRNVLGARRVSLPPTVQTRLLDPAYKVKEHPRKYFVPGRVFLTLWTEPASAASAATSNDDVAVSTHSGRGSPQANKNEHGIVFTGKSAPVTQNERGMQPKAIRVNPDDKGAVLDPKSRLNYGKVYNIEHNVKVKNFGSLSPEYLTALLEQFTAVFTSKIRMAAGPAPATLNRDNRPDMTGKGPKDKQQFLDPGRRGAVAAHTRHANNAAAGGRTAGTNPTRAQQPVREPVESDDEDDEDDGNIVEDESSDEEDNDGEEGDDDEGDDDDDDDEDDDEQ
ncbi:hypothetical protein MBLNU13_g10410t2 [Cladosporium sp. NU13]